MLINALCDYYDILARKGKVVEEGYSKVDVSYSIALTPDGRIDRIIDCRTEKQVPTGKGKTKTLKEKQTVIMPRRTEKPGIDGNIIEHRPLYIFGLNREKDGTFTVEDKTDKAKKSHAAFVDVNLKFIDGLDSPLINAYRSFIEKWNPEEEAENECLLALGREYDSSSYAFCLSGRPDKLLNDEPLVRERWELCRSEAESDDEEEEQAQCAVTGRTEKIARIHDKIKGMSGGQSTGNVLIGYKSPASCSYGHEQSYNSNISESAMKKYTGALNILLGSPDHKVTLDDVTVVFWAMSANEAYADDAKMLFESVSDTMNAEDTEQMLKEIISSAKETGKIVSERLKTQGINPDVNFFILGIKPNVARISVKFIYRRRYAEFLMNVAQFQEDLRVTKEIKPVSIYRIKHELVSPKSAKEKVNPVLISKLFESMLMGTLYPTSLLETAVRRVKTDKTVNPVRVGLIKAYINRNHAKEDIKVGLDRENKNQAYLCGRLFAIYEKLQQAASGGKLNRTIKDAYFASACSKPSLVFPHLARLANYHMDKVKTNKPVDYDSLIRDVMEGLEGGFPETLPLVEQGKFIVGYYQQYNRILFFEKNAEKNKEEN